MKAATIFHLAIGLLIISSFVSCVPLPPPNAAGGDVVYQDVDEPYSREELAQMLAPIALYPDALLSQILMASTYPYEVIEADHWVESNRRFTGEALDVALLDMDWDPSVKTLCHFPPILDLMSDRYNETINLGNAFLAQENEVMDVVQELRAEAYVRGNLATSSRQRVIVQQKIIVIEPADPRIIYVPYYDPAHIYGPWSHPGHLPHYWAPPGVSIGIGISYWPGLHFGFVHGFWSHFDWHRHSIQIEAHKRPNFVKQDHWRVEAGRWQHDPRHRQGVSYRGEATARRYGQVSSHPREGRRDTHSFPGRRDEDRVERDHQERGQSGLMQNMRGVAERAKQEQAEREQKAREQAERARVEKQKKEREQAARVKQRQEARAKKEKAEREQKAREQAERARVEKQKKEHEQPTRAKREQAEQEKKDQEQNDQEQHDQTKDSQPKNEGAPDNPVAKILKIIKGQK